MNQSPIVSAYLPLFEAKRFESKAELAPQHLATAQARAVAVGESRAIRGTMATRGHRALSDVVDVRRQGERFLRFVTPEPNTGCLLWMGAFDKRHGYGYFRLWPQRVIAPAHRVAWVLANGQLPDRVDIDHAVCNNRWCVDAKHLEAVSHAENLRRRDARRMSLGLGHNMVAARAALAAKRVGR